MNEVKHLPVKVALEPNPDVIKQLEALLNLAKEGKLRAVAFSYVRPGMRSSYGYSGAKQLAELHALHSGLMTAWTVMGVEIDATTTEANPESPED
jgi:hypothetical protein